MVRSNQLLVIERIEIGQEISSADVRIADQSERVVIRTSIPALSAYEQMPDLLGRHAPARRAVIDLLSRAQRGEVVHVPVDLTSVVRDASEPWPLPPPSATTPPAPARITRVERDTPEKGVLTAHVSVGDTPAVVVVDPREGRNRPLRFRFADGLHPWQASAEEAHAMLLALAGAVRDTSP